MAFSTDGPVDLELGDDVILCDKDDFQINTEISDPAYSFLWNNGKTSSSIVVNQYGTYSITMTGSSSETTGYSEN